MKLPYRIPLVPQHLFKFHSIQDSACPIRLGCDMPPPNLAFHVVLKKDGGCIKTVWKIYCCIEKVADCNIESSLFEPLSQHALHGYRSESAYRIGSLGPKMQDIVESASHPSCVVLLCV